MILYLYNRHEELIGSLSNDTLMYATQVEQLQGAMTIDFAVNNDNLYLMEDVDKVVHEDVHNPEKFHMYKIINKKNENGQTSYQAINIFFDEMKGYNYVVDFPKGKITVKTAVTHILKDTPWVLKSSNVSNTLEIEAKYLTPLDALRLTLESYHCELQYYITIQGNQITGKYVEIKDIIGVETGRRFVYGHNAIDVVKEEVSADLFTAIIPLGISEKVKDPITNKETGERRYLRIDNVTWLKSEGKPLDKPKGQEYLDYPERSKLFGYKGGRPIFKVVEYSDIKDRHELIYRAYQDLEENSRPKVQFRMSAVDTDMLDIGDIVSVIRHDIELYYKTRVFKIERDLISGANKTIEFGDNLDYSQAKKNLAYKQMREKDKQAADQRYKDSIAAINEEAQKVESEISQLVEDTQKRFEQAFFDEDGYNYDLRAGNDYNLPSGYYSFNRPIDKNPTKAIYVGAGKLMISDKKDSWGDWIWSTAADGSGLVADMITTGVLNANLLRAGTISGKNSVWDLETGYFNVGDALVHYPNGSVSLGEDLVGTEQLKRKSVGQTHIKNAAIGNAQIDSLDARYMTLRGVTLDNFVENTIQSGKFILGENGFQFLGASIAFQHNSNYLTMKDTGGRGQMRVQGTCGVYGSGYVHELNSGGVYLNGARLQESGKMLYAPDGLKVEGHQLYVDGKKIDKYIVDIVNQMK